MADATATDTGEFGLIALVVERLGTGPQVLLGPGDDAAVVAVPDGRVVATTDLLVEGVHFRQDWSSGYDVGRKAAAANLADVMAMGGTGTALLVGLSAPGDLPVDWALALADGLRDEAALVGAVVVGGDTTAGERVVVAVTALGDLAGRPPVTRAGARPGDDVVVAGHLGRSAAGLALLEQGVREGRDVDLHRRPEPPYATGPALAAAGATALCDVSDGLVADLGHVARASGVVIALDSDLLRRAAPGADLHRVLTGGEDHGLAGTVPAGTPLPAGFVRVGTVQQGPAGVLVDGSPALDVGGSPSRGSDGSPSTGGWEHFS